MTKYRDNRDWITRYKETYKCLVDKMHIQPRLLFETPKEYDDDGVAYKNGDVWYKFNVFTTKDVKNKKFASKKIYIKNKEGLIKIIYKYIILLKHIGSNKYNTYYCVYRMIAENFLLVDNLFDCTKENLELIADKICYVYSHDLPIDDSLIDNREFCFKSDVTNKKSKEMKIVRKNKGDETFNRFKEIYKDEKNKVILASRMKLSVKQIGRLIKRYEEMGED